MPSTLNLIKEIDQHISQIEENIQELINQPDEQVRLSEEN
jgi:hypothetical protein